MRIFYMVNSCEERLCLILLCKIWLALNLAKQTSKNLRNHICANFSLAFNSPWVNRKLVIFHKIKVAKHIRDHAATGQQKLAADLSLILKNNSCQVCQLSHQWYIYIVLSLCGLYYKQFTIIIYDRNTIGQYYKTT
jgi:hypothetical protein